ncbi:hypothetical protein [Rhizobium laguerreae]|uniref:hypothetical protein n=1 Tax=Rhizobium laguerreae TaxID=1076926 RepID=UPI001FEDB4EF|nr:hypothetical protein [Rhizobium laguerreae]
MRNEIEITDEVIEAGLGSPNLRSMGGEAAEGDVPRCDPFHPGGGDEWCAKGIRSFRNLWFQRMNRPDIPHDPGWGSASFGAKSYRPYISRAAL